MKMEDGFWTFDLVQERLVEAYGFLRRLPDREAGWLRTTTMGLWREVKREWGDYVDADERPRIPGLTRNEVARMDEALEWLGWVKPESRKIVGTALRQLHNGYSRIAWGEMTPDPTQPGSSDRLRMAYGRALNVICRRLNSAKKAA